MNRIKVRWNSTYRLRLRSKDRCGAADCEESFEFAVPAVKADIEFRAERVRE